MVFFGALFEIPVFSLLFSIISFALNKTLGERDKVKHYQKQVQAFQKAMQQAMLAKNEKKLEELRKRDKEMNDKIMQVIM